MNKIIKLLLEARIDEHCRAIKEQYELLGQGISGLDTPRMKELQKQLTEV